MKWSSSSNSSLSSGGVLGMAVNISGSNNNSSISSNGSTQYSSSYTNGNTNRTNVRRHASDRRSIFYTDPDDMEVFIKNHNNKKMSPTLSSSTRIPTSNGTKKNNAIASNGTNNSVNNTRLLQQANGGIGVGGGGAAGAASLSEADEMQKRKCENLISFFTTQIHHLNKELEIEKRWRDTHLAKIVKSLLCFEAKLKSDQKQIRLQLYEKDAQLNRLAQEVIALREKYGVKDGEIVNIDIDPVAQYCPNCRKQYYNLSTRDISVQVNKHELNCHNDGIDKENAMVRTSSSDDGLGDVFSSEARRSKRYMSKRTSGTFREYLKSRNIELNSDSNISTTTEKSQQEQPHETDQQQKIDNKSSEMLMRKGSMRRSNKSSGSLKCDKNGNKPDDKNDTKLSDDSKDMEYDRNGNHPSKTMTTTRSAAISNSSFLKKYDDEVGTPKTQFESTDDWYASASDMDDSDSAVSKPYGYNAVNPVLECVNQILLQQSMDGIMENLNDKTAAQTNSSATIATNGSVSNSNSSDASPKEVTTNTLKKRVHFSTQNSMVQVPRTDSNIYQTVTSTISTADTNGKDPNLSYATIYSNEYEPIGSENTNHYVDMESKLEDDRPMMVEKSKTPPALPPKPSNLISAMKFRQILKMPMAAFPMQSSFKQPPQQQDNESEPDYCSIGDVQEAVKSVQIVVDVHKNADDDVSSHASEETKTDVTDTSFADVPKLPNVAAIISPKKDVKSHGKIISQDNYITKSSPSPPRAKPAILPTKAVVANLLSEINAQKSKATMNNALQKHIHNDLDDASAKKNPIKLMSQQKMTTIIESTTVTKSTPSTMPPPPQQQQQSVALLSTKIPPHIKANDKMIQAEFDWYNLDVEYGKLLSSNLHDSDKEDLLDAKSDEHNKNFGVEYNLDAEFSLTSCSLSSDNNSSIESSSSTIHFVPITVAEEDVTSNGVKSSTIDEDVSLSHKNKAQLLNPARLKKLINKSNATSNGAADVNVKSFDTFLEQTGLTAKPLPQKRKIFYNAPFV